MDPNRRNFIRQMCATCGSILILPACSGNYSKWRFFTEREAALVIAIAEQFIPADKDPGATDARVINYIDKQLVGPYTRFQDTYRKGLLALDASCKNKYSKAFVDLDWLDQAKFLEIMEKNELPASDWEEINQRSFFRMLLSHTMQGFYGSPRHGGNANYVSYKMMKIDYPHVIGQNRYGAGVVNHKRGAS
jgi:gluconate 2-dehydrogenase gamma chain